jgi:glycogen(starch) synthase
MESAALGVPAITTDLSGFGAYVQRHIPESGRQGIMVLDRSTAGFDQTADDLAGYLFEFTQLTRRQRVELRNRVERLSEMFDWSVLGRHYREAHDLALARVGAPRAGALEVRAV